jgi:hypothetical protein
MSPLWKSNRLSFLRYIPGNAKETCFGCLGLRMTESEYDFDKESLVEEKS